MTRVLIQAVPWDQRRVRVVRDLLAQVPDAEVVWDRERSGYRTFKLVMEAMGDGPGILLEDDVILCERWRERVEDAISTRPDELCQFFATDALPDGWFKLEPKYFGATACVYFPAGMAADFLGWDAGARVTERNEAYYDLHFGRFLAARRRTFWMHVPSLVQHRAMESVVNPNRSKHRQSPTYRRTVTDA